MKWRGGNIFAYEVAALHLSHRLTLALKGNHGSVLHTCAPEALQAMCFYDPGENLLEISNVFI